IAGIALVLSAIVFVFLWGYSAFRMPGPDPPETTIERETGDVPALAFSSDSRWLAFTDKRSVKLCDMNAGGAIKNFHEFNESRPSCAAFTPDSKEVLVGTWSNRMYVLEIGSVAVRETISFEDRRRSRVLNVAVSSVDDWVAISVNYEKPTGPNSSSSEYAIEVFQLGNSAKRETLIEAG